MNRSIKYLPFICLFASYQSYGMSAAKEKTTCTSNVQTIIDTYTKQISNPTLWGSITQKKSLKNRNGFLQCDITNYEHGMTTMTSSAPNGDLYNHYLYQKLPCYLVVTKADKRVLCYVKINEKMQPVSKSDEQKNIEPVTQPEISSQDITLHFE